MLPHQLKATYASCAGLLFPCLSRKFCFDFGQRLGVLKGIGTRILCQQTKFCSAQLDYTHPNWQSISYKTVYNTSPYIDIRYLDCGPTREGGESRQAVQTT